MPLAIHWPWVWPRTADRAAKITKICIFKSKVKMEIWRTSHFAKIILEWQMHFSRRGWLTWALFMVGWFHVWDKYMCPTNIRKLEIFSLPSKIGSSIHFVFSFILEPSASYHPGWIAYSLLVILYFYKFSYQLKALTGLQVWERNKISHLDLWQFKEICSYYAKSIKKFDLNFPILK